MEQPEPAWPTLASLYVEPVGPTGKVLAGATAFLIRVSDRYALVTARHVVTGLHEQTKRPLDAKNLATPTSLRVWHPAQNWLAHRDPIDLPLLHDDGEPTYRQDPTLIEDESADVAVLPYPIDDRITTVRAYDVDPGAPLPDVASTVWIVGYPQRTRMYESDLAVWNRGSVASDPVQGWHGDRLLIDSRTRKGQSGAPVIRYVPRARHDEPGRAGAARAPGGVVAARRLQRPAQRGLRPRERLDATSARVHRWAAVTGTRSEAVPVTNWPRARLTFGSHPRG